MKNVRTPRTLAECQFWCGYPIVRATATGNSWRGWLLAIAIGASLGALIARSI